MVSMSLFSVKEQTTEVHTQAGWILELHLLPAAPGHLGTACLPAQSSHPRRCPFCLLCNSWILPLSLSFSQVPLQPVSARHRLGPVLTCTTFSSANSGKELPRKEAKCSLAGPWLLAWLS